MSLGNKPGDGLGARFYEKYKTDFFPSDECPVPNRGVYKSIPRYYETLYAKENPESFAKIKRARKKYRDSHADKYTTRRLEDKYKVKKAQLSQLRRS